MAMHMSAVGSRMNTQCKRHTMQFEATYYVEVRRFCLCNDMGIVTVT